jgi:hypothetical protein
VGFVFFRLCATGQSVDWQKAGDWSLYAVHGKDIWKLSIDSVDRFPHVVINEDSIRYLMANAAMMGDKNVPVWMGGFVVTCRLDNQKRKLLASSYGGRFYDEMSKQWYQVAEDRRQEWLDYLANLAVAADNK